MDKLLLLAMNALIWGLIIALIALGLAIIFGLLDIINIAHGDFFMVGTVLAWATLHWTGSFWPAFVLAPLICFILGALIHRLSSGLLGTHVGGRAENDSRLRRRRHHRRRD